MLSEQASKKKEVSDSSSICVLNKGHFRVGGSSLPMEILRGLSPGPKEISPFVVGTSRVLPCDKPLSEIDICQVVKTRFFCSFEPKSNLAKLERCLGTKVRHVRLVVPVVAPINLNGMTSRQVPIDRTTWGIA